MRGPGLFSEIGKKGKDLLGKDYSYDQKLTFSTRTETGVGLTTNAVKKGGLYVGDVASQYKYKNTTFDVKVDTESNVSSTVTLEELLPFTKAIATFKLPDYSSGKLEVQYFHDHASVAGAVALKHSPTVDLSATVGAHGIAFGAEAGFDTSSGTFTKYNAGLSLKKPDYIVSILLADKGDTLRASYVHHLDAKQKSAAVAEITRKFSTNENTLTVGSLYELDSLTSVKTRLNNGGKFGALLQHQLRPNNVLTISGEFDTKALDKKPSGGGGGRGAMADAVGAALGGRLWSSARRRRGDKIGFFRRGALRDVVGIAISSEGRRGVAVRSEASRLIMAAEGSRGWEEADAGGGGRPSWLAPVVEEHGFADGGSSGKATSEMNPRPVSTVGNSTNIAWHECPVGRLDRQKLLGQKGCVIWITGLSGSGKSTLACALSRELYTRGCLSYVLDGDNVRHGLNKDLSFKPEDRAENIRRIGEVAKLFSDAGIICIASLISPYRRDRDACRALLPEDAFIEVFMDMPLEVCEARDVKGLYKLSRAGKIKGFTGIDDPYEPPSNCEILIQQKDGICPLPAAMADQVILYLERNGFLQG